MLGTKKGFTIVELLIVVVVIAILAAITIVAYNGIQNKAKNSQMVTATSAYAKAIKAYYISNGDTVPMATNGVECFDGTSCWSGADVTASQALRAKLQQVASTLPVVPSGQALLITNSTTSDFVNGGNYTGWYVLYQVVNIDNECPIIGGLRYLNGGNSGNLRSCRAALEF